MTPVLLALTLALAALVVGCGSDSDSHRAGRTATAAGTSADQAPGTAERTSTGPSRQVPVRPGKTIKLGASQYGKVLFDGAGQAIYLFDRERSDTARCYGDCAAAWPPVLTSGEPRAVGGVDARLLGTTRRRDGRTQVTYNGHPLYYYAHEGRNEVRCHNVPGFGGLWLALGGDGDAVA